MEEMKQIRNERKPEGKEERNKDRKKGEKICRWVCELHES
jgi:hypothetical protein